MSALHFPHNNRLIKPCVAEEILSGTTGNIIPLVIDFMHTVFSVKIVWLVVVPLCESLYASIRPLCEAALILFLYEPDPASIRKTCCCIIHKSVIFICQVNGQQINIICPAVFLSVHPRQRRAHINSFSNEQTSHRYWTCQEESSVRLLPLSLWYCKLRTPLGWNPVRNSKHMNAKPSCTSLNDLVKRNANV